MTDSITKAFDQALEKWGRAQAARDRAQAAKDKAQADYSKALAAYSEADLILNTLIPLLPKDTDNVI